MNEAETRAELIDPLLVAAGWGVVEGSRIRREFPIAPGRIEGGGRRGKSLSADYVLSYRNTALAVVEAKAWDRPHTEGVGQAKRYAAKLAVRFTYSTNGQAVYGIDMATGAEGDVADLIRGDLVEDRGAVVEHAHSFGLLCLSILLIHSQTMRLPSSRPSTPNTRSMASIRSTEVCACRAFHAAGLCAMARAWHSLQCMCCRPMRGSASAAAISSASVACRSAKRMAASQAISIAFSCSARGTVFCCSQL
jgi:hypothetical protein